VRVQFKLLLILLLSISTVLQAIAQDTTRLMRFGFTYARGSQQCFPYNDPDYNYSFNGYKLLFNYPLKTGLFSYELQLEPSVYAARHQLMNEYYIQPDFGDDYLLQREIYTQEKTIMEYAFNIGIQVRYNITSMFSLIFLGSIGPMYSSTQTERLAKGFAFSDIAAFGAACKFKKIMLEIKPGLRHVSNLDIQYPNAGHNATTIDFGISVFL
jgi:hypothetical protein